MGHGLDSWLVQEVLIAVIAILVYFVKKSMDKRLEDINSNLVSISNNITNTQVVNIHSSYPEPVIPDGTEDESESWKRGQEEIAKNVHEIMEKESGDSRGRPYPSREEIYERPDLFD